MIRVLMVQDETEVRTVVIEALPSGVLVVHAGADKVRVQVSRERRLISADVEIGMGLDLVGVDVPVVSLTVDGEVTL
jgi:hypothetical protein